jgi:hypothetical protein
LADGIDARLEVPLPLIGGEAWRPVEIPRVERATEYAAVEIDGRRAVRADGECSASGLAVRLDDIDLAHTPILRWQWKIDRGISVADERSKAGDDFAARVLVMFRFDSEDASFVERMLHRIGTRFYGDELPGRTLSYVWASGQPAGAVWRNPFRSPTMLISRGSGEQTGWRTETVDVAADYRKSFDGEPPPLFAVAVMTDTDNTCQTAVAHYADFRFLAVP